MSKKEIHQAVSKALEYARSGQFEESQRWGEVVIRKLELHAVFKVGSVTIDNPKTLWMGGHENQKTP